MCPLVNEKRHANDMNQICYSQIADVDIWDRFLLSSEINWKTWRQLLDMVTVLFSKYTVDKTDLKMELHTNKYTVRSTILEFRYFKLNILAQQKYIVHNFAFQ